MTHAFDAILSHLRHAHATHAALRRFCPFPDDLSAQYVMRHHAPCADHFVRETGLRTDRYGALAAAIRNAGGAAHWQETYKGSDIGADFMERFGCYQIIGGHGGRGGAFASAQMWAWMVFMPPHLYYPWHHHPAEELYLVVAGTARFMRAGHPCAMLNPGDVALHGANQPHAMETGAEPVLAVVLWRNGFDTAPVLSGEIAARQQAL